MSDEDKKYLDEEDLEEATPEEDPVEPEGDPASPDGEDDPDEEGDGDGEPEDKTEPESVDEPEGDWQEAAKKAGWVPDHVREKHAREAQTLRDQVKNLQMLMHAASKQEEEVDPNEVVRHGDLERHIANLEQNIRHIQDPAVISEILIRQQVADYDHVVVNHLEPFADTNPWVTNILRGEANPAKAAYDLACALRDGRNFSLGFKEGRPVFQIEEAGTPTPKKKDPTRPPVKALERSQQQPKSLDEIPSADSTEAAEMSVEEFWKLPSDTLMRMRTEKPELYLKMRSKFNEKYG